MGFSELRKIIDISAGILSSGGMLALEFGVSHADQITEALSSGFEDIEILKDLSHYRRFFHRYKNLDRFSGNYPLLMPCLSQGRRQFLGNLPGVPIALSSQP